MEKSGQQNDGTEILSTEDQNLLEAEKVTRAWRKVVVAHVSEWLWQLNMFVFDVGNNLHLCRRPVVNADEGKGWYKGLHMRRAAVGHSAHLQWRFGRATDAGLAIVGGRKYKTHQSSRSRLKPTPFAFPSCPRVICLMPYSVICTTLRDFLQTNANDALDAYHVSERWR